VVAATTRKEEKRSLLKAQGAAYTFLDDGSISGKIRSVSPGGVNKVLDFVGPAVTRDSMQCLAHPGYICISGVLGKSGVIEKKKRISVKRISVRATHLTE